MQRIQIDLTRTPRATLTTVPGCRMELSEEQGCAATPEALKVFRVEAEAWPQVVVEYTGTDMLTLDRERLVAAPSSPPSKVSPPETKDDET